MNISIISVTRFVFNYQDLGVTIFFITLDKINSAITYKELLVKTTNTNTDLVA